MAALRFPGDLPETLSPRHFESPDTFAVLESRNIQGRFVFIGKLLDRDGLRVLVDYTDSAARNLVLIAYPEYCN
jgi:hypothetical protein